MNTTNNKHPWWLRIKHTLVDIWDFLTKDIWSLDLSKLTRLEAFGIKQIKVLVFVIRQFYADKLLMRASSLTYSTLLAIVPFLAVIFSISKGLGLHLDLAPVLSDFLSPLGPRGDQISAQIMEFVGNAQTGTLGYVGCAVLLLTVYGILNKIELSYNDIWHVPRIRSWPRRLAGYTLLTVIGPMAMFLVLALTASLTSTGLVQEILSRRHFALLLEKGLKTMPYALSCLLFALIIWTVPNVRVRFKAAVAGGAFSGILWQLSNLAFARFVAGASRASARDVLFAGFAALPLFLLWIYISWSIMLLGTQLGYVIHNVGVMEWRELEKQHGDALRRFVGVRAVLKIVRDLAAGKEAPGLDRLAEEMRVPQPVIGEILQPLLTANILTCGIDGDERYVPTKDPSRITMAELLLAFRGQVALPGKLLSQDPFGRNVERLLQKIDSSMEQGISNLSLHDAALWAEREERANNL